MVKQPHAIPKKCGAKTRSGKPCKAYAMPNGRCRMHGGKSTGPPKKNKNAVTTGERESIVFDFLEDDEKELLNQIELNQLKQADNEIKLYDIRLRRMMQRITKLEQEHEGMTTIKTTFKKNEFEEEYQEIKQDTLSQIQNIEEAITRVQTRKLQALKTKHDLEMDLGINTELKQAQLDEIQAKIEGTYGSDTTDNRTIEIINSIPNVIGGSDD